MKSKIRKPAHRAVEYLKEKQKSIRKRIIVLVTLFVVMVLSSCKKSYTCTCTYTVGAISQPKEIVTAKSYKGDASAWCTGIQSELNSLPGSSGNSCVVTAN